MLKPGSSYFDDEESVSYNCQYIKERHMDGVMSWPYASDPKEYLLTAVNEPL